MRDIAFSLIFAALSAISLVNPFAGLLSWSWVAFTFPGSSLWGFAATLPSNLIIAIATIVGLVLSPSKLAPRFDRTVILLLLFAGTVALSLAWSLSFEISFRKSQEYAINFAFLIVMFLCLTTKVRLDAFIWMMVFCIGYYSLKGGAAFLINGGAYRFEGPVGTSIGDNNHLALAFLLSLPLMNYLRLHAARPWVRQGLAGAMLLTVLAVLCTQSRGGFIGLVVLGGAFWWFSGRRVSHMVVVLAIAALATAIASQALVSRLQTLETAHKQDNSFLGRVASWHVHTKAALDRPLVGAGPYALQTPGVFARYRPAEPLFEGTSQQPIAAHSIYFQVLGDHGFLALALFLALIWTAWRNATWVIAQARDEPSRLWMAHLASMTRLGLLTFSVSGAAVSMAFYDYFLATLMLTACLRCQLQRDLAAGRHLRDDTSPSGATTSGRSFRRGSNPLISKDDPFRSART